MDKGAHFYRCDLQVHSPRDIRWTGAARVTVEERRAYAEELVAACRERGLGGIAVTDHHDLFFASYVRQAAVAETDLAGNPLANEDRLVVFPGMELTLGVPCQALLIFDADFPDDMFSLAMTALPVTPNPDSESRTAETKRLDNIITISQLKQKLDEHTFLRGRYIILPNVSGEGKSSLLRTGLHGKYAEMPCVGAYVDGDLSKLKDGPRNILAGKDKNWGGKRVACFQTSDNRREDHQDLGVSSTWIKWAVPTAEALRQACLAQESRVSQTAPRLPDIVISSLSVSNSAFLGPVNLELNPQYSALIGGRGTGKSTILEYLRWALCDQPPAASDEDTPNYQARRARLIEKTLKPLGATVQVAFVVNGVPHTVRRHSADGSLLIKVASDEMRPCTEGEIRSLLPIQAYSQKQLSNVSVLTEELLRFVAAPIRRPLREIEAEADSVAGRLRQSYAVRRRRQDLAHSLKQREIEEKSLAEQAEALRKALTGLSPKDRELLDQGQKYDGAATIVEGWEDGARALLDAVNDVQTRIDSYAQSIEAPPDLQKDLLQAAHDEYALLLNDANSSLKVIAYRAESLLAKRTSEESTNAWRKWAEKLAIFKELYTAAVQRSSAHSEKMKQLGQVEDQLAKKRRETSRVIDELKGLEAAEAAYQAERTRWIALLTARDDLFESQCALVTKLSGGTLRARVERFSDPSEFLAKLRQALSGSRMQAGKFEKLTEYLAGDTAAGERWSALLADLERLSEIDAEAEGTEQKPPTPALSAAGMGGADIDRIIRSLNGDDWLNMSLTPIKSKPVFEFRARENEYIPFNNASAGQQATALLKTLLNDAGPPLIIDQPEEDLDNPVMLEIVAQVWEAKQKRQVIFASHNANLVVNGDAELVVWCDHRTAGDQSGGTIAGQGAIDVPEVRDAIKRIMEGGEAAFTLRQAKYGF